MDDDIRVDAHWNVMLNGKLVWLEITGTNGRTLLQEYIKRYGPPSDFEVSTSKSDVKYIPNFA